MGWAARLAHWTAFAQSSLALPKSDEGERWRSAVASIVGLQAVTYALAELDKHDSDDERGFGQDKAEVLIRQHASELHALWRGEPLPDELAMMISDARGALAAGRLSGVEWRVKLLDASKQPLARLELAHPAELSESLIAGGFGGDLFIATPGVSVMPGSPIAFARGPFGGGPGMKVSKMISAFLGQVERPQPAASLRQVYRQYDFGTGKVRRDLVVPIDSTLAAGQPLLVPAIERGEVRAVTLPPPPGAVDRLEGVRVEFSQQA